MLICSLNHYTQKYVGYYKIERKIENTSALLKRKHWCCTILLFKALEPYVHEKGWGWGGLVRILCLDLNVDFLSAFENHCQKYGLVHTDVWREYNWIKGFLKHRFHLVTSTSMFKLLCTIKHFLGPLIPSGMWFNKEIRTVQRNKI